MPKQPTVFQAVMNITSAAKASFPFTLPILAGFLFLGMTYGLYTHQLGFSFIYPLCMALFIFAGSMEFLTTSLLLLPFAPVQTFLLTLMVNARHLFYGLSMLDRYRHTGKKKWFLIFGLCDETFSLTASIQVPEGIDAGWFYFFITLFNYVYWVLGALLGSLIGQLLPFNLDGLSFVMTAMFVVLFMDGWKTKSSLIGLILPTICLLIFGPNQFIIPSMILMVIALWRQT